MVQPAEIDNLTVPSVSGHHQSRESTHLPSEMSENHCLREEVFREKGEAQGVVGTPTKYSGFFSFISVMCQNFLIDRVE